MFAEGYRVFAIWGHELERRWSARPTHATYSMSAESSLDEREMYDKEVSMPKGLHAQALEHK
jgi:hypothetical protein